MVELAEGIGRLLPVCSPELGPDEAHVWALPLDVGPATLAELASDLSVSEMERAGRFRFARHRDRFIAGRGFLRLILGRYLEVDPARLQFTLGPCGKPALARPSHSPFHFNLAHSAGLALVAVTRVGTIGVDLEQLRPVEGAEELVARFFSPREALAFRALPTDQRALAFFNLWTRKEAWLKATGEGIGRLLHRVEVSFLPNEPARLLALPTEWADERWQLHDLALASGFVGALAVAAASSTFNLMISYFGRRWGTAVDKVVAQVAQPAVSSAAQPADARSRPDPQVRQPAKQQTRRSAPPSPRRSPDFVNRRGRWGL